MFSSSPLIVLAGRSFLKTTIWFSCRRHAGNRKTIAIKMDNLNASMPYRMSFWRVCGCVSSSESLRKYRPSELLLKRATVPIES